MKEVLRLKFMAAICGLVLVGCGSEQAGEQPAASAPSAESTDNVGNDIETLLANADVERGQMLYLQCRACHSLEEGGANKVGPNLHGMFGRKAGLAPGFAYSDPLANSGIEWSPANLDQWLARPSEFLPGNRMVFVGIKKPQDRANLIAFLQRETE